MVPRHNDGLAVGQMEVSQKDRVVVGRIRRCEGVFSSRRFLCDLREDIFARMAILPSLSRYEGEAAC